MNAFRRIRDYAVFTRNEQKILLFLSVVFLAGAGIKAYRASTKTPNDHAFEYTHVDSVFAARSAASALNTAQTARAVDLNSATRTQLMSLPGIGPVTADRILAYRTMQKRFRTTNDLKHIVGIGAKKFSRLRGLIEVKPDTAR